MADADGSSRVTNPRSRARRQYSVSSEYRKNDSSQGPHAARHSPDRAISAPVAQSATVRPSYAAGSVTSSLQRGKRPARRLPITASPSARVTLDSRRSECRSVRPSSSYSSGTLIPTRPPPGCASPSASTSTSAQPRRIRTSGLHTRAARKPPSHPAAAASAAFTPAAYPALRPVWTTVASGASERTTSTVSSAESLSATTRRQSSPAMPSGSEARNSGRTSALFQVTTRTATGPEPEEPGRDSGDADRREDMGTPRIGASAPRAG